MRYPAVVVAVLLLLFIAAPAIAWNKPGHMIVGAVAYDVLAKEHPKTLAKVLDLLRQHPEYTDDFAKKIETVPSEDRDRYLFEIAARWPDDIRDDRKYTHPVWHYVDFPYVLGDAKGADPGPQNAISAMKTNTDALKDESDAGARAIALCWIFHLTGDLHQPLHCVSLYSPDYPEGDRGGNRVFIKVAENRAVIDLHALWDGLMTSSTKYKATTTIASELLARPDFARRKFPELKESDPQAWAKESFKIAVDVVYAKGKVTGSPDRDAAPVLPEGYAKAAKAVAERRIVLAGYRLADLLVNSLGK